MSWISKFLNRGNQFLSNPHYFYNEQIGNKNAIYIDMNNLEWVYNTIAHLQTVINNDAEMVSNLQLELRDKEGNLIENDPLLDLLYKPNPLQNGKDFITNLVINENIYGNAFVYKNYAFASSSIPSSLMVIPSKGMEANLTGKIFNQDEIEGIIKNYKFELNGLEETFETKDIIHFKQNDNNLIFSDSKLLALKPQLSNIVESYKSRNVLITDRGANGIISYKGGESLIGLNPEQIEQSEKEFTENYGIQEGQKKVKISKMPLDFISTSFKTKDLMLFEEVADDFNVILDAFGQNINIYSKDKGATFNNYKESLKGIYINTIIPKGERIANTLTNALITDDSGKYFCAKFDLEILKEDDKYNSEALKIKVEALTSLMDRGVLTTEQVEQLLSTELNTNG